MAKYPNACIDLEYSIEGENDYYWDYESSDITVLGKLKRPLRYNLKNLIESNTPEDQEIVKSLVSTIVEKNLTNSFRCLLHKNYQISPLNEENQTALHLAFYKRAPDIIFLYENHMKERYESYLKDCETSEKIDYTDINGLTHLHVACAYTCMKFIDIFSKNSSNINARFKISNGPHKNCSGFTPIHFAMTNYRHHNKDMIERLIKQGADVNAVDDMGRTPLHIISDLLGPYYNGDERILQVIKALIDCQADVNSKDNEGNTPLFMIFSLLNDERKYKDKNFTERTELRLKLFLEQGADTSIRNNNNDTILHFAVNYVTIARRKLSDSDFAFDDSKIVQLLELIVAHNPKIDVNVKNNDGETPLKLAISSLSIGMVRFFLEHNADSTDLNFDSKTDSFFNYSYRNLATFKPLRNLTEILELLWNEGCILKPQDNLTVLKFLINNGQGFRLRDYNFKSDIFHMMCIESSKNLKIFLRDFRMDFDNNYEDYNSEESEESDESDESDESEESEDMENSQEYLDYLEDLRSYCYCIKKGQVFMNKKSKTLLKKTISSCKSVLTYADLNPLETAEIRKESKVLKSLFINDECLSNILMKKPENVARYLGNEIDESLFKRLYYFQGIVKCHLTLGRIRYYVIKLAYNCIIELHSTPLPYICYELLTDYLSNKDILNLCLALLT